jgi:ppGpp synthetase/RelA/SpoT-type nucleotidyltranferase
MAGLNRAGKKFIDLYELQAAAAAIAAEYAKGLVSASVEGTGAFVHVITARPKTPASLRGKLRRKRYDNPQKQLKDLVGVRVITYYRDDVDPIVAKLRKSLEVDEKESTDKRQSLGLRNFGYRSVHLIARPRGVRGLSGGHPFLREHWFEIQVRSLLEHVWAEIEHEVVYKAGVKQPEETTRRFAALAGTLELLDAEFLALRKERTTLITRYVGLYKAKKELGSTFDAARLLAFLLVVRPGQTWPTSTAEEPVGSGLEAICVEALKAAGLSKPSSLAALLRSKRFTSALRSFAALKGIAPEAVSHLAVVVIAVAVKKPSLINIHFPEMKFDPAIVQLFDKSES